MNLFASALLLGLGTSAPPAPASLLIENLTVLQLAADDRRAVVRIEDGAPRVVAPGDPLRPEDPEPTDDARSITVVEILADRLVIEVVDRAALGLARRVWIYPPEEPGARSRIQWLDPVAPRPPPIARPVLLEPEGDLGWSEGARSTTSEPPPQAPTQQTPTETPAQEPGTEPEPDAEPESGADSALSGDRTGEPAPETMSSGPEPPP